MGRLFGGGGSEQTQTTTTAPPPWAAPLFNRAGNDAMNLYNSGQGGNVYQGNRVVDLSGQTNGAINGLQNTANDYNNSNLQNLIYGGTSSGQNLGDLASGKLIGNNPQFNEALQNTLNNAATTINSQLSGAGRYGSGAHNEILANNLGQISANAQANQYNQDINNMFKANQQIDYANQNQLGAANNFLQGQSNAYLNSLRGGNVLDQNAQNKLNADWQKWNETDNQGWNRLSMLLGAAQGSAGNYGTSTGNRTTENEGGTLGGIGGIIGSLFRPFGISDRRLKENIVKVGTRNKLPIYEFNYKGIPSNRFRGVMAQDVQEIMPDAVRAHPINGFLMVNYHKIGFPMESVN